MRAADGGGVIQVGSFSERRRFAMCIAGVVVFWLSWTGVASPAEPMSVFADAVVAQVGPRSALDRRPASWATVTVKLVASDVDPAPPACSSCSTGDVGRVEISRLDPDDQRAAILYSGPIQWVDLDRASAGTAYVSAGGLILTLVDRGAPGSKVIGRPGPTGVAPTRDSVRVASLGYPRVRTYAGAVRAGAIEIRRRH